jgi:hypothetical protein
MRTDVADAWMHQKHLAEELRSPPVVMRASCGVRPDLPALGTNLLTALTIYDDDRPRRRAVRK